MLDERRLRTFTVVAATGSIAGAAAKLAFTPPAVSQQIAALERHLGCRLLERSSRGVRLTEAGEALLALTRDVLVRLDVVESTVRRFAQTQVGPLALGAFGSAGWMLLPRAFTTLRELHPDLRLSLVEAEPPQALAKLIAGEVDLAVTYTYDGVPADLEPSLEVRPLGRDPLFAVLPEAHPAATRTSVALADLAEDGWIVGQPDAVCTRATMHACHAVGFIPDVRLHIGDFTTVCGMVSAGMGVALVPAMALPAPLAGIRCLPITGDPIARRLWAASRPYPGGDRPVLLTDALTALEKAMGGG